MVSAFVSWQSVVELLLSKGIGYGKIDEALLPLLGLGLLWLILLALYRRRIFLRV